MFFYTQNNLFIEWENHLMTIHLTNYVPQHLGRVVAVALPEMNRCYQPGELLFEYKIGDLNYPVAALGNGEVVAVNDSLRQGLIALNANPEQNGWICKIKLAENADFSRIKLLTPAQYTQWISEKKQN